MKVAERTTAENLEEKLDRGDDVLETRNHLAAGNVRLLLANGGRSRREAHASNVTSLPRRNVPEGGRNQIRF